MLPTIDSGQTGARSGAMISGTPDDAELGERATRAEPPGGELAHSFRQRLDDADRLLGCRSDASPGIRNSAAATPRGKSSEKAVERVAGFGAAAPGGVN